jgi:hypothetical protein
MGVAKEDKNSKEKIEKDLWNYYNKADLGRSIHGRVATKIRLWYNILNITTVVGGGATALFIYADPKKFSFDFSWTQHASALVFIAGILSLAMNLPEKIAKRESAIDALTVFMKEVQSFIQGKLDHIELSEALKIKERVVEKYSSINSSAPKISDSQFLKGKQKHKRKIALSKTLDKDFHQPLWWIRLKLIFKNSGAQEQLLKGEH